MNPLVSIIVTTKNEQDVLEDLLKSIKGQTYEKIEVIVVDNNSTDATKEISKKYTQLVFNKGPERSAQRNYGVEKSSGAFVVIIDADMQLEPKVIEEAVEQMKDTSLGAVIIPERSFGKGFWTQFKVFEREFYVGEDSIEAARFFRRDLFKKFGGYDLSITGPEDWDLPLRMRKAGVKMARTKSYILHNERVFSPWKSAKKKFYYASGASVYLKRHPDVALSHGNLLFRNVFFKKWMKLISHPYLATGMFFVRVLEASGAVLGVLYSLIFKKNVVNSSLYNGKK
ncbi:MAG: glycosyltransferase [bacterium]|nr:glycosyltransferase [bacterium]